MIENTSLLFILKRRKPSCSLLLFENLSKIIIENSFSARFISCSWTLFFFYRCNTETKRIEHHRLTSLACKYYFFDLDYLMYVPLIVGDVERNDYVDSTCSRLCVRNWIVIFSDWLRKKALEAKWSRPTKYSVSLLSIKILSILKHFLSLLS